MYRSGLILQLAVLGAALTGCTAGDGMGLDANGRPPGESGPVPPGSGGAVTFQQVQDTVLTPVCTACHAGSSAPLGLRLDAGNSYALLFNVASVEASSLKRVSPGDSSNSYLVQKIEGRAAVGARMPLGGAALPQSSIDLVKAWIDAGARPAALDPAARDFTVRSSIPANGEMTAGALQEITVVMNGAIDAASLGTGTVELIAERSGATVALEWIRVAQYNASVVTLRALAPLEPGSYELIVQGGAPDGDYRAAFLVPRESSR
jgi:hypothetical protein